LKRLKVVCSSFWGPALQLRSVVCHMGSHSVTCHPTQDLHQPGRPVLELLIPEGWKAELT